MTTSTLFQSGLFHEPIKLGIDAPAEYNLESRQIDGTTPQRRAEDDLRRAHALCG